MAHFIGNQRQGILGGLTRGTEAGARIGLGIRESGRRDEAEERRGKQQELTNSLGRLNIGLKLLDNKNLPASMKLDIWNNTIVPEFSKLQSQPGSKVDEGGGLGKLEEFPDALRDTIKSAVKIVDDKKLSPTQKLDALSALQVEAGKDVNLAPMIERQKAAFTKKKSAATLELQQILEDGIQPKEAERYTTLSRQFPSAAITAAKNIDAQRKAAPKPTKLTVRTEGGRDKIVMLVDGQIQQFDLGATDEEKRFNGQQFRARLIMRINGLKTGDAFFDKKIDANKARTMLDDWNKSDPFLSFMQRLTGTPTEPSTGAQEEADAFFKEQ